MTLRLDPPRRFGRLRIAVLSDHAAGGHRLPQGAGFFGRKLPVAILIGAGGGIEAFAPDGTALDLAAVEALYPGLGAEFSGAGQHRR